MAQASAVEEQKKQTTKRTKTTTFLRDNEKG